MIKRKSIIEVKKNENRISLKNFVLFSLLLCPVWIFWYIFILDKLRNIVRIEYLEIIITFVIFSIINWINGNKKNRLWAIFILNLGCFIFLVYGWVRNNEYSLFEALTLGVISYPIICLIIVFAQFATWIPFLIKFTYQNRKRLDNIKWE